LFGMVRTAHPTRAPISFATPSEGEGIYATFGFITNNSQGTSEYVILAKASIQYFADSVWPGQLVALALWIFNELRVFIPLSRE